MELKNQVCLLQQAIKLKALGVEQHSLCCFMAHGSSFIGDELPSINNFYKADENSFLWVSAFTIAEMGEMLPSETGTERTGSEDSEYANWEWASESDQVGMGVFSTEAEARADMLIYLLEEELVDVKECNKRLIK